MLTMIDMNMGNLQSVIEAFRRIGAPVHVTTRVEEVEQANTVILPGVGAFGDGMAALHQKGLVKPLQRHALEKKKPLFGICIGMQLLADEGEEHGLHQGLGLIRGRVVRLQPSSKEYRVPNMGWCQVTFANPQGILHTGRSNQESFYFAHSYHLQCHNSADIAATFDYGDRIIAVIERDNVFGVQFHPEKSQDAGLNVLDAFVKHIRQLGLA